MRPNNSPLEHLSAFAIVFAAGFLTATSLSVYVARVRRRAGSDGFGHAQRTEKFPFRSPTRRSGRADIPMPTMPVQ